MATAGPAHLARSARAVFFPGSAVWPLHIASCHGISSSGHCRCHRVENRHGTRERRGTVMLAPYNPAEMLTNSGNALFLRQDSPRALWRVQPFPFIHQVVNSVSEEVGGFHKGKERTVGRFSNGNSFPSSSVMKPSIPASAVLCRPGAQLLINISNDGSVRARPPPPSSTCEWRESAPSKTAAGLCETPTAVSQHRSTLTATSPASCAATARFRRFAVRFPYRSKRLTPALTIGLPGCAWGFSYSGMADFSKGINRSALPTGP